MHNHRWLLRLRRLNHHKSQITLLTRKANIGELHRVQNELVLYLILDLTENIASNCPKIHSKISCFNYQISNRIICNTKYIQMRILSVGFWVSLEYDALHRLLYTSYVKHDISLTVGLSIFLKILRWIHLLPLVHTQNYAVPALFHSDWFRAICDSLFRRLDITLFDHSWQLCSDKAANATNW